MLGRARCLLAPAALLLSLPALAWGAGPPAPVPAPRTPPQVQAAYVDQPPVIDGRLDDACWSSAARLEGFFVPNQTRPVPEETIGLISVDSKNIYVGVICKDRTPDDIKGVETRRNGEIWKDDLIEFGLDPEHRHQDSYYFQVTSRGTQHEDIPGGSATKIEWRGDWTGTATRTPEGYQVELAIPFAILRYPPGQTTFGITLYRSFAEEEVGAVYPDMGKTWNPNLAADVVGLHPPAMAPRPLFMPFTTVDLGSSGRSFGSGMDVQYRLRSGLTALGTYHPDYTQIEEAVEPISFSYTERYLPEVRPFFVTGTDGFFPGSAMFYSRRIQDFDSGTKLFGTVGKEQIGLLDALSYGQGNAFVGAWQHNTTPDFHTRFSLAHRQRVGEPDNLVYALNSSRVRRVPDGQDSLWGVTYQSTGADANGSVYELGGGHYRGSGKLHYDWSMHYATDDYHPALGYYYDQGTYGASLDFGKSFSYEKGPLQGRFWRGNLQYSPYLHDGGTSWSLIGGDYTWIWRTGRYLGIGMGFGAERNDPNSDVNTSIGWNNKDLYRQGNLFLSRGVRAGGDYTYCSLGQGFRAWKVVSLRVALEYSHLTPPSPDAYHAYQAVATTSYDLTTEKSVAARFIFRDAGLSAYAAYRQVVRRGLDAYVIIGDPDPELTGFKTRVAVKLIRVL